MLPKLDDFGLFSFVARSAIDSHLARSASDALLARSVINSLLARSVINSLETRSANSSPFAQASNQSWLKWVHFYPSQRSVMVEVELTSRCVVADLINLGWYVTNLWC